MKRLYAAFLFALINLSVWGQNSFIKAVNDSYPGTAFKMAHQTADGGYIIAGTAADTISGDQNIVLIKTTSAGDTLWTRRIGGNSFDEAKDVTETLDSGYLVVGSSISAGSKAIAVRTDQNGNIIWMKSYGTLYGGTASSVIAISGGRFVIAGHVINSSSYQDAFILEIDSNGNHLWSNVYADAGNDYVYSLSQTSDSGLIISGYTDHYGAGTFDAFLMRADSVGTLLWCKTIGTVDSEIGRDVKQTSDGGFITCGYYSTVSHNSDRFYISKTDDLGNISWTKSYPVESPGNWEASILENSAGFAVAYTAEGMPYTRFAFLKTDLTGNVISHNIFDKGRAASINLTTDGSFVISGNNYLGGLIVKTDPFGITCHDSLTALQSFPLTLGSFPFFVNSSTGIIIFSPTLSVFSGAAVRDVCTSTSVLLPEEIIFNVFPNPTSGDFKLEFPGFIDQGTIDMINLMGEIVRQWNISAGQDVSLVLNVGFSLPPGMYFLKFRGKNISHERKLVLVR
jgi:hypothetical protein